MSVWLRMRVFAMQYIWIRFHSDGMARLHHTMMWWTMPSKDRCNRCEHFTRTKTRFEMMRHSFCNLLNTSATGWNVDLETTYVWVGKNTVKIDERGDNFSHFMGKIILSWTWLRFARTKVLVFEERNDLIWSVYWPWDYSMSLGSIVFLWQRKFRLMKLSSN